MFTLKFKTGNAAFQDYLEYEVGEILTNVAECVKYGRTEGIIKDINGSSVGEWKLR